MIQVIHPDIEYNIEIKFYKDNVIVYIKSGNNLHSWNCSGDLEDCMKKLTIALATMKLHHSNSKLSA